SSKLFRKFRLYCTGAQSRINSRELNLDCQFCIHFIHNLCPQPPFNTFLKISALWSFLAQQGVSLSCSWVNLTFLA
ncbi:hypothetical protein ANANG_G00238180, partial [Anguilla anguilla]